MWLFPAIALMLVLTGCGGGSGLPEISGARVGAPTGPNAALYFTARSNGDADTLLSVSTDAASEVEIHETMTGDGGTMSMRPLSQLDLPADGQLTLEPGGYHLMLVAVGDLDVGSTISVTLTWETAGEMTIEAEVVEPSDTIGDEMKGSG